MKILFFLAVWKRPEITEICFMGLNRLKRAGLFPCDFLAVISEESMKPLCKKYGVDYVMHENLPVGRKKNFGLTEAFKKDWDYLIELGSDDILKTELLEVYRDYFGKKSRLSIGHLCFINSEDGDCRVVNHSVSMGLGRAFEREALKAASAGVEILAKDDLMSPGRTTPKGKIGFFPTNDAYGMQKVGMCEVISEEVYKIWDENQSSGMDNRSNFFLSVQGMTDFKIQTERPLAIDIKSDVNIWPFHDALGVRYPIDKALDGLSEEEKTAIKSLCENKVLHI